MDLRISLAILLLAAACGEKPAPSAPENLAVETPSCDSLTYDVIAGTINGLPATASPDQVKSTFPCAFLEDPEPSDMNYGGGVFFGDHEMYWYTGNDFVEVRTGFPGTVNPALLGVSADEVVDRLGEAVMADDQAILVARGGVCIRAELEGGVVDQVSTNFRPCDDVAAMNVAENNHF